MGGYAFELIFHSPVCEHTCVKACPSLSLRSWSLFTSVCLYSNNTCLSLHVEGQRNVEENELSK